MLSLDEAGRLIASSCSPKYRAALSVADVACLRASELIGLNVTDVDSGRMVLRVEQGKGHNDRYAMLSPALLDCLRAWWRTAHAEGKILPGGWLFPGQNPVDPLGVRIRQPRLYRRSVFCRILRYDAISEQAPTSASTPLAPESASALVRMFRGGRSLRSPNWSQNALSGRRL